MLCFATGIIAILLVNRHSEGPPDKQPVATQLKPAAPVWDATLEPIGRAPDIQALVRDARKNDPHFQGWAPGPAPSK